jgi:phosphotransferase system enzyme I (PtsP)
MASRPTIDRPDLHLKVVHEISQLINHAQGLDTILAAVVERIADALHFDVVSVYLLDESGERLRMRSSRGLHIPADEPITLRCHEGLTGLAFTSRRPVVATPASQHPSYKFIPQLGEERFDSYLGVPILLGHRCLGVLVGQTHEQRPVHPAEETLFQVISSRLAGLLEVADRLDRLARPVDGAHAGSVFQGRGVSEGFALGPVRLVGSSLQKLGARPIASQGASAETDRLENALRQVADELDNLADDMRAGPYGDDEVAIIQAQRMLLADTVFQQSISKAIAQRDLSAENAVVEEIESVASQFERQSSNYFRERAGDIRDVGERLLQTLLALRGEGESIDDPDDEPAILIAPELGPSMLASIGPDRIAGILTERGGDTSHVAILARSLGIPAVTGIEGIARRVKAGRRLLVDGRTGFVFQDPDDALIEEYRTARRQRRRLRRVLEQDVSDAPAGGLDVSVSASVGHPADVDIARQYGLTEVGLFRTEFVFMLRDTWPGAEEQAQMYQSVARPFSGGVTVRTLDIGGDKTLPYYQFPRENNPLLGLRSIRFSMEHLELLHAQMRGLLLARQGGCHIRILLPLVTSIWEVETAREMLQETADEIGLAPADRPPLGIMVETPALVHQLTDYKGLIDFVSIGTNDLIQYLLAVDRDSNIVGHLYSGHHPAVLRALAGVLESARQMDTEVSVCGEMAATPLGALALMALGYRRFSVLASRALVLRHLAGRVDEQTLEKTRLAILAERKEAGVRRHLADLLETIDPILAGNSSSL